MFSPEAFRRARLQRDHSQEQAAQAIGVSTSTVSKWEAGVRSPKAHMGKAMAYIRETAIDPKEITKARALRGQTIRQAATDLHVDPAVWGKWEKGEGESDPDVEELLRSYIQGAARFAASRGGQGIA